MLQKYSVQVFYESGLIGLRYAFTPAKIGLSLLRAFLSNCLLLITG